MKKERTPTEFLVDTLTDGYCWSDFLLLEDLAYDYAIEVLGIPGEYIESAEIHDHFGLKISLRENDADRFVQEDWYCALRPFVEEKREFN
jgi:hypothetical protein